MFRALIRKKLVEFQANKGPVAFVILLAAISLLPLLRLSFDHPVATFLPLLLMFGIGVFLGPTCASGAFQGDFANEANRFLEYLPLRRSAIWLASYLSGLVLLCAMAVALLWLEVLLFPLGMEADATRHGPSPGPDLSHLAYLVPGRWAMAVSCGSILFWMFSVATFPAAYLDRKDAPATANPAAGTMVAAALVMSIAVVLVLGLVNILPSGLALSPVLLTSAVLYSAGSYVLFALTPKHISAAKRGLLGFGLFLAISAALVGQLYVQHLAWRVLDPSLPLAIERVHQPHPDDPNRLLADVNSYRSGRHCVSIALADGAYHDLGRGLTFLEVPDDDSGLLHFGYARHLGYRSGWDRFVSMTPDATTTRSFKIPGGRVTGAVRWLPGRGLLVYAAYIEEGRRRYVSVLCAADTNGTLLKQVPIHGNQCLATAAGLALAIAPPASTGDPYADNAFANEEKPYMLVDLDGDTIRRFGLPGNAMCFSKDLKRVVCSRVRIRAGRRYTSYFLVELPTMAERPILSEDDLPADQVTSQVSLTVAPSIATNDATSIPFLRVNDAFDTALWIKQRLDGDHFRYAIVRIDLTTGQQEVVVPESATLPIPVVAAKGAGGYPTVLDRFTADQAGFLYSIGPRVYLCEIKNRQSVLLADHSIRMDGTEEDAQQQPSGAQQTYATIYSPSGRRALRLANVWQKPSTEHPTRRLRFAAIEVFQDGKPVRVHTGERFIRGARWLDEQRIVFHENEAIYLLDSAGGPPQQVFPPAMGDTSK